MKKKILNTIVSIYSSTHNIRKMTWYWWHWCGLVDDASSPIQLPLLSEEEQHWHYDQWAWYPFPSSRQSSVVND
jgi:hypothetical protein